MWQWPAAGRNEFFKQGVLAAAVLAGGQEAVNVTNDGDGATLAGFSDDGGVMLTSLCWGDGTDEPRRSGYTIIRFSFRWKD